MRLTNGLWESARRDAPAVLLFVLLLAVGNPSALASNSTTISTGRLGVQANDAVIELNAGVLSTGAENYDAPTVGFHGGVGQVGLAGDPVQRSAGATFTLSSDPTLGTAPATIDSAPQYVEAIANGGGGVFQCTNNSGFGASLFIATVSGTGACPSLDSNSWSWQGTQPSGETVDYSNPNGVGSRSCCVLGRATTDMGMYVPTDLVPNSEVVSIIQ